MKNRIILILIGLWISTISFSQKNEYQYIGLRFGASHGFSGTPDPNANKYLVTKDGDEMQASPVSSYKGYTPGYVADFYYHFDFTTNNAGIITGLEYNYGGLSSKYQTTPFETSTTVYTMQETFRMHTVGVPIAFKYGPKIKKTQSYVFAGFQINYVVAINSVQKYSWTTTPSALKLESGEYNKTAFNLFLGVNYRAFNLQIDYYPSTVFNRNFDKNGYKVYDGMVKKYFDIKTSIKLAYGWLSDNSFWWKKKLRKVPFWK